MTKLEKNFTFLQSIFKQFFERKQIKDKLNKFSEIDITGWKNWLQIELVLFLRHCQTKFLKYIEKKNLI